MNNIVISGGSIAHHLFAEQYIFPKLDKFLNIKNHNTFMNAKKMNKLWRVNK